jgi:pimeloyl-ACP methyl ester carboxylesterase
LADNPGWSAESRAQVGPMYFTGDLDHFAAQLLAPDGEDFTRDVMATIFSPSFVRGRVAEFAWIIAENLKMPRDKAIELRYATSGMDWCGTIQRIRLPTLVIGAEDSTYKVSVIRWIASRIPGAKVSVYSREDGGSHFMFIENAERFNKELRAFIEEPSAN